MNLFLFHNKKYIIITHVDDYLVFYKDEKIPQELISSLKNTINLMDKEDLAAYLGTKTEN